jgi:hypothetical protein
MSGGDYRRVGVYSKDKKGGLINNLLTVFLERWYSSKIHSKVIKNKKKFISLLSLGWRSIKNINLFEKSK